MKPRAAPERPSEWIPIMATSAGDQSTGVNGTKRRRIPRPGMLFLLALLIIATVVGVVVWVPSRRQMAAID